jgi:hypothetical protein
MIEALRGISLPKGIKPVLEAHMKIVYEQGQLLGNHGVRYLEETEGVTKFSRGYQYVQRRALFLCNGCKKEFCAYIHHVKSGNIKSCGCMPLTADGLSQLPSGKQDPIHAVWAGMIARCYNSRCPNFKNYGARGILVCSEWQQSFKVFRDWAITNGYVKGLHVDRQDNEGNYEPSNCRFVTSQVNQNNRRDNIYCLLDGQKMTLSQAARSMGRSYSTIYHWAQGKYPKKSHQILFLRSLVKC